MKNVIGVQQRRVTRATRALARSMCLGACVASALSASSAIVRAQTFDRAAWQTDYGILKRALERSYSHLAWFASPEGGVDVPALDRRTLAALRTANSDEDASGALLGFVRGFHDGHFSQLPTLAPSPATMSPAPGRFVYSRQDAAGGCAALSNPAGGSPVFSLPFEGLPGFHLTTDGVGTPFRSGIQTRNEPGQKLGIVRISSFEELSDIGLCVKAWTRSDVWDAQGAFRRSKLDEAVETSWYEALADILRSFKAEGVAAVLIDIGHNSGGDDSGDIAARLFTSKQLNSAPLWMSHDSAASNAYFDEQLKALRAGQKLDSASQLLKSALASFVAHKDQLMQKACPMDWVWQSRRPWSGNACRRLVEAGSAGGPLAHLTPDSAMNTQVSLKLHWPMSVASLWGVWSGPSFIITDERTYSSAEMFAAVLQNNGASKTVGSRTGGDGCGFMSDPEPIVLPHSRLRFQVPNCVRIRSDGTDEVAGIKPDIPVLQTEGETPRRRAMRMLDEVRGDLKRNGAERSGSGPGGPVNNRNLR